MLSHYQKGVQKMVSKCMLNILVSISGAAEGGGGMGPLALVALVAHHTPTLMSDNGVSWINAGFSADQNLLL
jgi:hypothetical protein